MKVCCCMTAFKNDSHGFMHIHFYLIKIVLFPWMCMAYVDIIIQVCHDKKDWEPLLYPSPFLM
jgi:hypothetical protein